MPKLLELCSGSGVVSKFFREQGWETVTVDTDRRCQPDLRMDVRDIELSRWDPGEFDCIWASPPCTEYSIAKTTAPRDLATADQIVIAIFDLIKHLSNCDKHVVWWVENPATGLLKTREIMEEWKDYKRELTYCKYGTQYRKHTNIWTNLYDWTPRELCRKGSRCAAYQGTCHPKSAQRGPAKVQGKNRPDDTYKTEELYGIPEQLIAEIFACMSGRRR